MTEETITVTVSLREWEGLQEDSRWRIAMESAGVDNWIGYDFGMELLAEMEGDL